MVVLEVIIPITATYPTADELSARNRIEDALTAASVGSFIGAGGGNGEMDISFRIDDEKIARAAIASIMQTHMPGVEYRVRVIN